MSNSHIFTDEQIDVAWRMADEDHVDSLSVVATFGELGIVACEECGGSGQGGGDPNALTESCWPCESCHGHGWTERNTTMSSGYRDELCVAVYGKNCTKHHALEPMCWDAARLIVRLRAENARLRMERRSPTPMWSAAMSDDKERDIEPVYATIHFYYNDPDSMLRMRECLDAPKWKSAVREFDQWIRGLVKYGEVTVNEEDIRERFHTIFYEHGIDIWDD